MAKHHPQNKHPPTATTQTHCLHPEPSHFRHHPLAEAAAGSGTPGTPAEQKWYHNNPKWWWGSWGVFFLLVFIRLPPPTGMFRRTPP
ncbi:hypothetical protein CTI12_AA023680 [Artemisia annua]|uniref:Uncharacterized protein n=1 Tax=Artemisia annua TaxID=35608 RepID=A0A2U1Q0Y9_ARTAN|nr:hypothetical protein CTI12_AA023680 [Artemisia annua]